MTRYLRQLKRNAQHTTREDSPEKRAVIAPAPRKQVKVLIKRDFSARRARAIELARRMVEDAIAEWHSTNLHFSNSRSQLLN
jgi:hypothetical protein